MIETVIIPKEDLEPLLHLTNKEIAKKLGVSVYFVKNSLCHHGLYKGKVYSQVCESCGQVFINFIKGAKFCSNKCKHSKQNIWNRGLTKETNEIVNKSSDRMKGNKLSKLVDYSKNNKLEIVLPRLNKSINYTKSSTLEKDWLLQADQNLEILDITASDKEIPYIDSVGKSRTYFPDFEVIWKSGVRWLVEVKGECSEDDLKKIQQADVWCKKNRMDFRIITMGMVKRKVWSTVFSTYKNLKIPPKEWIAMSTAVAWARLSPSPKLQVGAAIYSIDHEYVYAIGYNGDEKGGTNIPESSISGCDGFLHAEENALLKMNTIESCILYCTDSPCLQCAKRIIQKGSIKTVYYLRQYRDTSGIGLLIKHGIPCYRFEITNWNGTVFHQDDAFRILSPIMMEDDAEYHSIKK
jgi:dCMP deaminase